MKRNFRSSGSGRARRASRATVGDLIAEGAFYPRTEWGMRSMSMSGLPGHLACDLVRVPEGLVFTARCDICGGRYERLTDLRAVDQADDPKAAFKISAGPVLELLTSEWLPAHESCPEAPREHHMPVLVQEFVQTAEERARTAIGAGEAVPAMIYLLDTAGRVYCIAINDVPPSAPGSNERVVELAARHAMLRELARGRQLDLLAALTVGEAWFAASAGPRGTDSEAGHVHSSPQRKEGLLLTVVTSTAGWIALADIRRKGGVIDEGPGAVGPLKWSTLKGECGLLDTVLA